MAKPVRRNFAHLTPAERQAYIDAVLQADLLTFPGGVSYWDKQDEIHQSTHNHGGNSFLPWHRELVNRYEALLQQANPDVALHYWDWTEDPRAASDGQGGTVDLSSSTLLGTMNGMVDGPLAALHNGGALAGSREQTRNPADPPQSVERGARAGAPGIAADATIITSADGLPQAQQWQAFRNELEGWHGSAHGYIGGDIGQRHAAFEDPFVFLLHSNVDRLFAMWQTQPGNDWRLDPDQVYGDQSGTTGTGSILATMQPWNGTVEFGAPIDPWTGMSASIEHKNCRDTAVVRPPCYDTLPLAIDQVSPAPGDPVRFLDVVEHLPTARALRLRVRGCVQVTATASVTGPFTILGTPVISPEPAGFEIHDLLVWVLYTPGDAGTSDNGTLTVTIAETGDAFTVPVTATVVPNPTVATSLVLDRSGSMDLDSGLPMKTRMQVLHASAPLLVSLLDDTDGVGVVRFDTDAAEAAPVKDAGPMIGGGGRLAASNAINNTTTNPAGLTAIGDGLESGAAQLALVTADYDHTATIVFTDGHETAGKTIAAAASSVHSRVFAIGLGTADQLNPGALSDIANGTGGYLLLTGNPGIDDQLLLQKYFAQVLAGATNSAIVVDPDGFVPVGGKVVVPFRLTAADIRADVLLLGEMARALHVELIAPDGTTLTGGAGAVEIAEDTYRVLRVVPADVLSPGAGAGEWKAVLSVDGKDLDRCITDLRKRFARSNRERGGRLFEQVVTAIKVHGVPFTLSVQARSALRLDVAVTQSSRLPGSVAHVRAGLTDSGIPLSSAKVVATVTAPNGAHTTLGLSEVEPGIFAVDVPTTLAGVYRVLVRAVGADLRGAAFTREELRTVAVWARGDEAPPLVIDPKPDTHLDPCELLLCLLQNDGVRRLLERNKIDPDRVAECVKGACR
ncbi:tyrosinase family protein [Lentzea sp. NPDC005914]|uniref:tyrosinase family protein n=1 Tax=Lentzea sp. NPDC005914 TaxID=3154572 RepID=UPI0034115A8E